MLEPGQRLWCLATHAESGEAQLMLPLSQPTWRGSDVPRDLQDAPQRALWLSDIKTQTERVQYHSQSEPRRCLFFCFFYVRWGKCWYTILDILVHLHWLLFFFWMVKIVSLFENVLDNITGFRKWTMCLIFGPFTWILKVHRVVLGKTFLRHLEDDLFLKFLLKFFFFCLNNLFLFMTE